MKSPQEMIKTIEENLPIEINGFKKRFTQFKDSCNIIYCKDSNFMFKNTGIGIPNLSDIEYFDKNVLYEVNGKNLSDCYEMMKQKINLNKQIAEDFKYNLKLPFNPSFQYMVEDLQILIKLFEIYLVLDIDLGIRFFSVVTVNPLFDVKYIIQVLNAQNEQIKKGDLFKFSGEDFDSSEFQTLKRIQLYSNDFFNKKEPIRKFFKNSGWDVKFKDKYEFERQKKLRQEKLILCEGKNFKILNNLNLDGIIFSEEHNSNSIFQNIKTREKYAIRDKDFLIEEEINRIRQKFPKYYILKYYCIESYLWHPDNVEELNLKGFLKIEYIKDITKSKNKEFDKIVVKLEKARNNYHELRDNNIKKVIDAEQILIQELKSDEFEVFYKHYDMKKYRKNFLEKFNLNSYKLAKTIWFKEKIMALIK